MRTQAGRAAPAIRAAADSGCYVPELARNSAAPGGGDQGGGGGGGGGDTTEAAVLSMTDKAANRVQHSTARCNSSSSTRRGTLTATMCAERVPARGPVPLAPDLRGADVHVRQACGSRGLPRRLWTVGLKRAGARTAEKGGDKDSANN